MNDENGDRQREIMKMKIISLYTQYLHILQNKIKNLTNAEHNALSARD